MEFLSQSHHPIKKQWLLGQNIDGISGWDLSTMLESFMVDWFPKNMYRRRVQLAGGELGNGFEMWRLLHIEYRGQNDTVEFGGVRRLQEFPRCTDLKACSAHLDDWLDILCQYGSELEHCPKLLKSMVLSTIPKQYEDELLTKPEHTRSYYDIIQWCRNKTTIMRTRELADFTRRPGHLKAFRKGRQEEMREEEAGSSQTEMGGGDRPCGSDGANSRKDWMECQNGNCDGE